MIDKLRSIAIFASVVDQGSFRAAARHLNLAPSRISETVSALEKDLGVTLLYRSTRQLSLTPEGRILHDKAQRMMATLESGLDAINPVSQDPQGMLRITAPAFVTQTALMDDFASFAQSYPRIELRFDFTDAPRDLIKDGFDVGLRAGWLEDSELMARSLGQSERLLVAHPSYVAGHPTPQVASDLETWDWVRFAMRPNRTRLRSPDGTEHTVVGRSTVTVNAANALYEFASRGLGVTAIPAHMAARGIEQGDLVEVLPDWSLRPLGLFAVWPDRSRRETLTILFVRFLAKDRATSG